MLTLANALVNLRFRIATTISQHRQRARWHAAMKLRTQALRKT
jgi:hypothetical protein